MSTGRAIALIFILAIGAGYLGIALRSYLPAYLDELALGTILVVASLMFGATGILTVRRGEFPLLIMIGGNVARALGVLNLLIWAFVMIVTLARYSQLR